jgi:hypothetical protein
MKDGIRETGDRKRKIRIAGSGSPERLAQKRGAYSDSRHEVVYCPLGLIEQKFGMSMIRKFAAALVVVYLALSAGLVAVMHHPILFGEVMRHVPEPLMMVVPFKRLWFLARAGRLKAGDPAPGFILPAADRQSPISLASFRGQKPVVLIFGSYT